MTTKDDEINSGYTRRVDLTDCHLERLNISKETGYDKPSGYIPLLFEEIG